MRDIIEDNKTKLIAFYLPQFHSIPENDKAWGKGFTEWTNMKKAKPLFEGHYQPRKPMNDYYYNLLDKEAQIWQANLAKKYGLFGFCYYHYWFKDGKKLLEKPLENMLKNRDVDIPFCISWANENWSKRWDGGNQEIIAKQDYGNEEDWKKHFNYLLDFFKDDRYISLNGKPIFLIYKPGEVTCLKEMMSYFERRAIEEGFEGICFMIQNPSFYFGYDFKWGKFDYLINFEPFYTYDYMRLGPFITYTKHVLNNVLSAVHLNKILMSKKKKNSGIQQLEKWNYDVFWNNILKRKLSKKMVAGSFVDWDNTPRKTNGKVFIGSNPQKFGDYMKKLIFKVKKSESPNLIFINAWNEWCEGAYLEPDDKYKYSYLEELQKGIKNSDIGD